MPSNDIHIIAGSSAAACLREGLGLRRESVLISHDVLSAGPLLPLDSLANWTRRRHDYLASMSDDDQRFAYDDEACDLLSNNELLRQAQRVTLWIGTGLADQLLLLWVIELFRFLDADLTRLNIVQFDNGPQEIVSVGVLQPAQFQHRPRLALDDQRRQEARAAWEAVTSADPAPLLRLLSAEGSSLPLLHRSLHALLYRYPNSKSGVNAWEYQLLWYTRDVGPRAVRVIGHTMAHDMDFPDWVGDDYLFHRLRRLGDPTLRRPLVALTGDTRSMRDTQVLLTREGNDVLDGKASALDWLGIDDWVGGVHLDSSIGHVWLWNGQTGKSCSLKGVSPSRRAGG
jgi:hypothetical protein